MGGLAALGVAREGRARSALAICPAGGSNHEQTQRLVKHFEILNDLHGSGVCSHQSSSRVRG